jgi:hypothetical protein
MKAMATESFLGTIKRRPHLFIEQMDVHGWNWRSVGALSGFCLGIVAPIAGSVLTIIAWATGPRWHGYLIHRDGTILFALTIPLLIFGAHCLDLLEGKGVRPSFKSGAWPAPSKGETAKNAERGEL